MDMVKESTMNTQRKVNMKTLALAFLVLPCVVWGQDKDASADKAEAVEKAPVKTEFTIGAYYLDDDSYRYGKYSGLDEEGVQALLDFRIEKRPKWDTADTIRWSLQGWRLGLDSRRVEFKFNDQGTQSLKVDYREMPNNRIGDGLTPYQGAGSGTLTLPNSWAVAPGSDDTSGFTALQENLVNLEIDTKRRRLDVSYNRKLGQTWSVAVDYRHETKKGARTVGGMFGNWPDNPRAVILPAPVDYNTDNVELMINYGTTRLQFGIGGYASFFSNDETSLIWQNAYGRQAGWAPDVAYPDAQGRLGLEPDNSYVQFKAYAGLNLNPSTRISADFAYGEMKQDEPLLPYTVNTDLVVRTPVPLAVLDAKIETMMFNFRATSQLARRLNLALNYHYDDRDNKTPQAEFLYIGGDSQDQPFGPAARINLPFSYRNQKGDAVATYRFPHGIRIKGGAEYSDVNREYSEVTDSNEFTWLAGIRFGGFETAAFNFDYRNSDRDVNAYIGNALLIESYRPGVIGQDDWRNHPLLRKYNLTDRERDEFRFRADIFPVSQINFGLSASYFKDDYADGFFGLNQAKIRSGTIDMGWYPKKNIAMTAYYTKDKYDASQTSLAFGSRPQAADLGRIWYADTEDDVDTYNVSLTFSELGENQGWKGFSLGLDYTYSNTQSMIDVTAPNLVTAPLPKLTSKMRSVGAWANLEIGDRSSIRLTVENAKLDTSDFAVDNALPDTLFDVLTLGESAQDYDVVLITGSLTYRF
jgi:MtrB/PioB family decaheme-associated outer membrane protein